MTATTTIESRHVAEWIDRPADAVYEFVRDPRHLTAWASGLASGVEQVDGRWFAQSPMGRVEFEFVPANPHGVLDHHVTLPTGDVVHNPMRVIEGPILDGVPTSEVVFTLRRLPGVTPEDFDRDTQAVTADLQRLKQVLEAAG